MFDQGDFLNSLNYFQLISENQKEYLDSLYYIGICNLNLKNYTIAINNFDKILKIKQDYNINIHLLKAICYKKLNQIENSLITLTEILDKVEEFEAGRLYRAKILYKLSKYKESLEDYEYIINNGKKNEISILGKAECLRSLQQFEKSLLLYDSLIVNGSQKAREKRGILFLELGDFEKSLNDFKKLNELDPSNSTPFYYMGIINYKQKNFNEALLSFEQSIKFNSDNLLVSKSIFEISKIQIELRDFYAAFHTLNRLELLNFSTQNRSLKKFKLLTEAVILLMKRKFKEGISELSHLLTDFKLGDFLKPIILNYRAFGFFSIGKYQQAIKDLELLESINKLDQTALYNKFLLEGILHYQSSRISCSLESFNKASEIFPQKSEPYFYQAIVILKSSKNSDFSQNKISSLNMLDKTQENNASLIYLKSILKFSMGMIEEAMMEIESAIDKSEDNYSKNYYIRGLLNGKMNNYKAAIEDFSIAIQLEPKNPSYWINRAKSYFLLGLKNKAFLDLKNLSEIISLPLVHIWTGHLLIHDGAFALASQAYYNAGNQISAYLYRMKSNILARELNAAINDLDLIYAQTHDLKAKYDKNCLYALKKSSTAEIQSIEQALEIFLVLWNSRKDGFLFKLQDVLFYKGLMLFLLGDIESAIKDFNQSFEIKKILTDFYHKKNEDDTNINEIINQSIDNEDKFDSSDRNEELYDFYNSCFNIYEYYHNICICYILLKNYKIALECILKLEEIIPEGFKKELEILKRMILFELKQIKLSDKDFVEIKSKEILILFPFNERLSKIFPTFCLNLSANPKLETRLSFCLPRVDFPKINIDFEEEIFLKIDINLVENKPEAPWIKRNKEGIVFTEKIEHFEGLDFQTDPDELIQDEENNEEFENNKEDLIEELKLDKEIEEKLMKIITKKQNNKISDVQNSI